MDMDTEQGFIWSMNQHTMKRALLLLSNCLFWAATMDASMIDRSREMASSPPPCSVQMNLFSGGSGGVCDRGWITVSPTAPGAIYMHVAIFTVSPSLDTSWTEAVVGGGMFDPDAPFFYHSSTIDLENGPPFGSTVYFAGLATGEYAIRVTAAFPGSDDCVSWAGASIPDGPCNNYNVLTHNDDCFGCAQGSVIVEWALPTWSPPGSSAVFSCLSSTELYTAGAPFPLTTLYDNSPRMDSIPGLVAGNYTLVLRAGNCLDTLAITLDPPCTLTADVDPVDATNSGCTDGALYIDLDGNSVSYAILLLDSSGVPYFADVDGSSGPSHTYLYATSGPGAEEVIFSNVAAGTYTVQITSYSPGCDTLIFPVDIGCGGNELTFDIYTDQGGEDLRFSIRDEQGNLVCEGDDFPDMALTSIPCTLADGIYRLEVTDNAGDGIIGGGYVLRTQDGQRIIDNSGNFSSGALSALAANGTFSLPIGTDRPVFSNCDKLDWVNNRFIVATENTTVSGQYNVTNTTSGYEFWIYDPNGSYSYRRFRSHATSDGFGSGATRACHMKINGWINSGLNPHVPSSVLMNVRIRGRVAGNNLPFGPACLFKIDNALAACPRVKLQDNPANVSDFSCGVNKVFGGGASPANRIVANPPQFTPAVASGNVRYQFRFRIPGEIPAPGSCITRPPQTSPTLHLNWTTGDKLKCATTYEVDVRVSKDGGATWCIDGANPACSGGGYMAWGKICTVYISTSTYCPGPFQVGSSSLVGHDGDLTLYPNPNRGDQLFLSLSHMEEGANTVSMDIYDLTSKRVWAHSLPAKDGVVNTSMDLAGKLASGMYLVNLTVGSRNYTERLVVEE